MKTAKSVTLIMTLLMVVFVSQLAVTSRVEASPGDLVYVIPVEGVIDSGLQGFLERSLTEAVANGATHVIMEIDTPGGYMQSALDIADYLAGLKVPTTAFVRGGAISAGVLIALSMDQVAMNPAATMGGAEPRLGNQKADEKTVSIWAAKLASAAQAHGRNSDVAKAMADADISIPGVVEKGKLLTLTSQQALELGMADLVVENRADLLQELQLADARVVDATPSSSEDLARWLTNPFISPILLMVGLAGIVIEIFTPGFGVPGGIGLLAMAAYFGGHVVAGLTGWEAILLFLLGVLLLGVEVLVTPGFGVAGIAGLVSLFASILISAPTPQQAVSSLVLALAGSGVLIYLSLRFLPVRRVWNRLVLSSRQETRAGFVASRSDLADLIGVGGRAVTPLRPAGTMETVGGERVDVVTEGEFLDRDTPVKVIKVEGVRVVVRRD